MLLNLRPGKVRADYEAWATKTDLPTVTALRSIEKFSLFETTGLLGSEGAPPYDYIEVLDVADMDMFGADVSSETMQRISAEFQEWATPTFVVTREVSGRSGT